MDGYPKSLMDELEKRNWVRNLFKLKGTGSISFHRRCDFLCDRNGALCFEPHKYIDNMVQTYTTIFGSKPKLNKAIRST